MSNPDIGPNAIAAGCLLSIVFSRRFKIYSGLWPLSVFPSVSVCVQNDRSNTSSATELAEFEGKFFETPAR